MEESWLEMDELSDAIDEVAEAPIAEVIEEEFTKTELVGYVVSP